MREGATPINLIEDLAFVRGRLPGHCGDKSETEKEKWHTVLRQSQCTYIYNLLAPLRPDSSAFNLMQIKDHFGLGMEPGTDRANWRLLALRTTIEIPGSEERDFGRKSEASVFRKQWHQGCIEWVGQLPEGHAYSYEDDPEEYGDIKQPVSTSSSKGTITSAGHIQCSQCKKLFASSEYTSAQKKKKSKRRCRACVVKEQKD